MSPLNDKPHRLGKQPAGQITDNQAGHPSLTSTMSGGNPKLERLARAVEGVERLLAWLERGER